MKKFTVSKPNSCAATLFAITSILYFIMNNIALGSVFLCLSFVFISQSSKKGNTSK